MSLFSTCDYYSYKDLIFFQEPVDKLDDDFLFPKVIDWVDDFGVVSLQPEHVLVMKNTLLYIKT